MSRFMSAKVVVERARTLVGELGGRHGGQGIGLLRREQRAEVGRR
jgi:hypothetical protein